MGHDFRLTIAVLVLASCAAVSAAGQQGQPQKTTEGPGSATSQPRQGQAQPAAPSDAGAALEFLGSYSAPQAVLSTETGHTSARPPSAPTDRRIQEIASDLGKIPAKPGEARSWITSALASPDHTPEEWFRLGTTALQAARGDSRRLAETAPASDWNRRLEAEALAARYPLLARSLWLQNKPQSAAPRPGEGEESRVNTSREHDVLSRARADLASLQDSPESPEVLYRRARALLAISAICYQHAAASPRWNARLFALQALAAEEEEDDNTALEEYRAGLARYPDSALLHAGLGHLYRARNDLEAARRELEEARRLDPTDPLVAFELGDVEERTGESQDAIGLLSSALELDPNLLLARWSRAKAYLALGGASQERLALEDLEAAAPSDNTGELQWQLAQLYRKLGESDQAHQAEQRSEEQRRALKARIKDKGPAQ